jgi:hypothetical protein
LSFLRSIFGKKKDERSVREDFERLGLTVISDERLRERLEGYKKLYDYIQKHSGVVPFEDATPEDKLNKLNDFVHNVNTMIQSLAIPWLRAGDEKVREGGRLIVRGWSRLYTLILDMLTTSKHLLATIGEKERTIEPTLLKEELIRKLISFIQKFYVPYALMIAGASWLREDVSPSWNVVVQAIPSYATPPPYAMEEGVKDMREEYEKMQMKIRRLEKELYEREKIGEE